MAQTIYNNRPHRSLFNETPYKTHFNSHTSSVISRRVLKQFRSKQAKLTNIFSLRPDQVFHKGEKVLLRKRKSTFRKDDPIRHPMFDPQAQTIVNVDKRYLPYTYFLSNSTKWYYFFELKKVSQDYGVSTISSFNNQSKVKVIDFVYDQSPHLRSGKIVKDKQFVQYFVERNDKVDKVSAETLRYFKKILGPDCLVYSAKFDNHQELIE